MLTLHITTIETTKTININGLILLILQVIIHHETVFLESRISNNIQDQ